MSFQPPGSEHDGLDTKLLLVLDPESFVALESVREPEKCVGIQDNGSLKPPENCTSSDDHAMFGVHLIVSQRRKSTVSLISPSIAKCPILEVRVTGLSNEVHPS